MLEVRNLSVRYGRHIALEGVSAKVEKGEICVILGANGAGKSSLLKAIAGMVEAEPGTEITMNGKPITGMKPHLIVEQGIALVPEGRGIFGDLTVAENLQLGAYAARARHDEAGTLKLIYELFPRLAERKTQIARTMSGGEQQMVAIGRALMSRPEILMLDEPTLGLSPILSKELFRSLAAVAETGVGILLVEQNARLSLKIARRGYLIENGLITGEDTAVALMNDPAVVNAYLGGGAATGSRGVRKSGIRLPPPFALPATLGAIGKLVGALAARAGAIHAAFIRALRRETVPPSAFSGRYDPQAGPDPWDEVASSVPATHEQPAAMPDDARRIAADAENLAKAAAVRLSTHLQSQRSTRTPTMAAAATDEPVAHTEAAPAFISAARHRQPASAQAEQIAGDAEKLAREAAARLSAHLQASRASVVFRPPPSAIQPVEAPLPVTTEPAQASHAVPVIARRPMTDRTAKQLADDAASLAEAAAGRLAAHVRGGARQTAPAAISVIVEPQPPSPVPEDARSAIPHAPSIIVPATLAPRPAGALAEDAESLATAAAERLNAHMRALRLANRRPGAELKVPLTEPERPEQRDAADAPPTIQPSAPAVSASSEVSFDPSALARAAGERLANHLRAQRAARGALPVPSAPVHHREPSAEPAAIEAAVAETSPSRRAGGFDAATLADDADASFRLHVKSLRGVARAARRPRKSALLEDEPMPAEDTPPLLGHNSAGAMLDDEPAAPPPELPGPAIDLEELAARAASIHAAHVARKRGSLKVLNFTPEMLSHYRVSANGSAQDKKRTDHKED